MNRLRRCAVLVAAVPGLLAGLAAGVEAQRAPARAGGLFLALDPGPAAAAALRPPGPGSARERLVRVDLSRLESARVGAAGGGAPPVLRFNLFDDVRFAAVVERTTPTSAGYSLSGRLDGAEGTMSLVVRDGVVAGSVFAPGGTYEIRPAGDDVHVIRQVDPAARQRLANDWLLPPPAPRPAAARAEPIGAPDPVPLRAADAGPEDGSRIDVLVVYTRKARAAYGGARGISALIDHFVAQTNQAYADSGVLQRVHLVHAAEVRYAETESGLTDLDRLTDPADGHLDGVHRLRERYAADLVTLIVSVGPELSYNVCGVAFLNWSPRHAPWGFNLVVDACGALVFAHELGHNMGLWHDRYENKVCAHCETRQNYDLRELEPYPYSVGYVNQRAFEPDAPVSSRWVTIMAYAAQCSDWNDEHGADFGFYCRGAPRFSNARRTYRGDPTGVPGVRPSPSIAGPADARRSLNGTRRIIANFRRAPCLRDGARIRLQAGNGQYVVAVGNGGDVLADRSQVSPGGRFTVEDANGGCVEPGDTVSLRTSDGFYLRARAGDGSTLDATAPRAIPWARFVAGRHRGSGPLRGGDSLTLRARSGQYVWAEGGGGSALRADRNSPGTWGRFTITHIR